MKSVTEENLRRYVELDEKRKELDRESRNLAKEQQLLADKFKADLTAAEKTEAKRGDYRVSIEQGNASVAWKDEFIRLASADEAARIQAAAPRSTRVRVTQI